MGYEYAYLIGSLVMLLVWGILYYLRKDVRHEMLIISIMFGIIGLFVDPIYSKDWWFPLTITNTMPGIESFLFGFAVGGVSSVVYDIFFGKRVRIKKANKKMEEIRNLNLFFIMLIGGGLFFISFFIFQLNSFYASFPALLVPLAIILIKRKDLLLDSIFSGVLVAIISFIFYIAPEMMLPGWIASTWNFEMISGILVLGVPIEDLIWFFLAGLLIGPLYEYWKEGKLVDKK
ncbi:MAG: hypothetical protein KKF56_00345 [Nanoarchaeota archaeon]|nr:hypothetical protein [Nanoarchaeota archaeon]